MNLIVEGPAYFVSLAHNNNNNTPIWCVYECICFWENSFTLNGNFYQTHYVTHVADVRHVGHGPFSVHMC